MSHRFRTRPLLAVLLLAAAPTLAAADADAPEMAALNGQAMASVGALASALKSELTAAMAAGGPVQAIDVCHARAPAIAREISADQGVDVSRVSHRNRNAGNAPTAWQAAVLEHFQARLDAGEDPASLTWQEFAQTPEGREYRFMKAIPTQPLCLACHGQAIAPPVTEKLAELYPADRATGFAEGDIRGAFVVTRLLD